MSGIQTPSYSPLPELPYGHQDSLIAQLPHLYSPEGTPGFITRTTDESTPGSYRSRDVGIGVLAVLRNKFDRYDLEYVQEFSDPERYSLPLIHTPEHLDGLTMGRFAQIHTNLGEPSSEVRFHIRKLDREAQRQLRDFAAEYERGFHISTHLSDMPDIVSEVAPIVGRFNAFLNPGDTLVFRNGFDANSVSEEDKFLTSHIFRSVDREGNPIDKQRHINVGYLASRAVKAAKPSTRRPFFGRKSA